LVLKKLAKAAMCRVDPPQQLAFVEPERDGVVALSSARLPGRPLAGEDDREAIEVGNNAAVHGLVERVQPRLVCEQLADGDALLALLREFRPVRAHALVVVEPPARMR